MASAYTLYLTNHLQRGQGLVPIRKGDFFPLFWNAWVKATRKNLVLKSFRATGIWPMDPEIILKRFTPKKPKPLVEASQNSQNWVQMEQQLRGVIKSPGDLDAANQLSQTLYKLQVRNELLSYKNNGLREALVDKKHHKKRGKQLGLVADEDYNGGANLWSPRKLEEAHARDHQKELDEEAILINKAEKKEEKRLKRAYDHQEKEKRKVE
ncbi:hypothetical protein EJ02DRAFT_385793, partial [Clathrospora elynae]